MKQLPRVGSRVRFRVAHDVYPHCVVPAGTVGFVAQSDDTGLWVLPTSARFPELDTADWRGRIQLYDHGVDGVEEFATIVDATLEVIPLATPYFTLSRYLADLALNAAAKLIQDLVGQTDGGLAGQFFSDHKAENILTKYADLEIGAVPSPKPTT